MDSKGELIADLLLHADDLNLGLFRERGVRLSGVMRSPAFEQLFEPLDNHHNEALKAAVQRHFSAV